MAPGCVTELYAVNAEAKAIACSSMDSSCLRAKKKRSDGRIIPPESANDRWRRLPARKCRSCNRGRRNLGSFSHHRKRKPRRGE
jgi:hypothetical protein